MEQGACLSTSTHSKQCDLHAIEPSKKLAHVMQCAQQATQCKKSRRTRQPRQERSVTRSMHSRQTRQEIVSMALLDAHLLQQHPADHKQRMWPSGHLETQHTLALAEHASFAAAPRQTPQSRAGRLACLTVHLCSCGYQAGLWTPQNACCACIAALLPSNWPQKLPA